MAVNQGPQISRTGLVAYYDASNETSFRGLPTTNLMYSVGYSWGNGANETFLKVVNGKETAFIPYFNRNVDVTFVDIYNDYSGGSNACCPAPMFFGDVDGSVSVSGNTTYMYQLIFKTDTGYYHPNYMYRYEYGSSGYITEGGLVNASRLESLGDGWFHAWGQFTTNASTTFLNCYLFHYDYATWNRIRVAAVSLTQGTTIHRPEHILSSTLTRGSTVATGGGWKSLVGSYDAELVNGVSFDSANGGSLVFDGVNDYINLSTNIQSGFTAATYEFFCKPTLLPTSGNYFQLYIQESSTWIALYNVGLGSFFGIDLGNDIGWFDDNGGVATGAVTNTVLSTNTWYHLVFSWNGSSVSIYLNGVLQNTASTNQAVNGRQNVNVLGPGTTNRSIGSRYLGGGNNFAGNIAAIKFYNRAISASEVVTNYNGFRSRLAATANRNLFLNRTTTNALGTTSLFTSTLLYLDPANRQSFIPGQRFWYDLSSNKRRVSLYANGGSNYKLSAPAAPTWSAEGKGSFVFDGVNDFGRLDTELTTTTNFTVSVWVKTTASGDRGVFSHCNGNPVVMGYSVETYMKYWYYYNQWNTITGNTIINDGIWKNLVWVTQGTNLKMYVNGVLDREVTLLASINALMRSVGSLWGTCASDSVPGNEYYTSVFSGSMGPLIVWSRALNSVEVVQLYDNFKSRYTIPYIPTNGLQIYLDATNRSSYPGTGLTWTDLSGNNRNFTLESGLNWNAAGYFAMNETAGLYWTGSLSSATSCTIIVWMRTRDQQGLFLHGQDGAYYVGAYYSADKEYYNNSGGNYFQDTGDVANVYDFLPDGNWHMVEFKDVNLSTWTFFQFNRYGTSFRFSNGSLGAIIVYNRKLSSAESKLIYNTMRSKFTNAFSLLTNNLVLNLEMSDYSSYPTTGVTWSDLSNSQANGILTNNPTYNSLNGGSLVLDGVDDYVNVPNFPIVDFTNGCTIEVFVKIDTLNIYWQRFIDFGNGAGYGNIIFGRYYNTNNIFFECRDNTGSDAQRIYYSTGNPLAINEIAYYAVTIPAGTPNSPTSGVLLYKNGLRIAGSNQNTDYPRIPSLIARTNNYIGRSNWADPYLDGNIYSVRIYNRVLNSIDIIQNYKASRARMGLQSVLEGLVLHLDAADVTSYLGSGILWTDLSGAGNNSYLTNGPTFDTTASGSIVFDGSNDRIECGSWSVSYLTVSVWVYRTSSVSSQGICRKENGWAVSQWNGTLQVAPGTSWQFYNTSYTIPLNTWVNIVYTYSGSGGSDSQAVYVNGSSIFTTSAGSGAITANTNNIRLGFDDNGWYWGGKISQAQIYNRAISSAEVLLNFNAERWRYGV